MKKRILFIMHMPPPIHGAAQMGQFIHDSKIINEAFECKYINPSASANVSNVGKLNLGKIIFLFSSLVKIRMTVKEWKPDLVYITPSSWDWGFYRDFLTVMMLKRMGRKIVAHYHNKGVMWFMRRGYNKWLYRHFFKDIKTIFLTKSLVRDFSEYLKDDQIYVCPNGVECSSLYSTDNDKKALSFNFLFLSNIMEEKGAFVLLKACNILKERNYIFTCTFVGKWGDITEDVFTHKVHEYNLEDRVVAVGGKYGNEKGDYFEKASCFVFPTYYHGECFPLVLLEAMSYSLPIISTNEGGIPDLLDDGVNGFIVERKDSCKLAETMAKFIDNPSMVKEMGRHARQKYEKEYTLQRFENNLFNILKDCLK